MGAGQQVGLVMLLSVLGARSVAFSAEEKTALMLLPGDIKRGAAAGTEGVVGVEAGSLHYPDQVMAFPIKETDENKELLGSWGGTHKFYVVPLSIGIQAADGKIPESLSLTITFPGVGALAKQPVIIDSFPKTGFSSAAFSGSASLKLDGDLKLLPNPVGSAGASADASMTYKYEPNYANVVSGYGSGSAFWLFTRTQANYPVGELPLKLVVAVPKQMVAPGMNLTADLKLTYSGPWWSTGTSVGSFRSHVSYPQ